MRKGGGRVRWWELPIVAGLLALGLVTASPAEPNLLAALGSGVLGALVYGSVWLVPADRARRAP